MLHVVFSKGWQAVKSAWVRQAEEMAFLLFE